MYSTFASFLYSFNLIASQGIFSEDTTFNMRISPQRNAIRHASRFFEVTAPTRNILQNTSGTSNIEASGAVKIENNTIYLEDSAAGAVVAENQNIPKINPIIKPELIRCDYPFTFSDYKRIRSNPYGIIKVNGEECYIKK